MKVKVASLPEGSVFTTLSGRVGIVRRLLHAINPTDGLSPEDVTVEFEMGELYGVHPGLLVEEVFTNA